MTAPVGMPQPPLVEMPQGPQELVTAIVAVVAALALAGAVVLGIRRRTPMYVLVLLGGSIASVNEPIADVLGGIIHPQVGGWTVFTTYDRPISAWVVIAYGLFFGLVPLIVLELMRGPDPRSRLLRAVAVIFAANLLIELPVLAAGMYVYHGPQPFFVFDLFPLHWLLINAPGVAGIAVALHRLGTGARGARAVVYLALPTLGYASALSIGVPAFSLFNSDAAMPWKWVGAGLTALLGLLALRWLSRQVPTTTATASRPAEALHA
jgi:hypothetical protein